jgi:2,3-bisphosphoglycerate-independent phosphoglycerate mutase
MVLDEANWQLSSAGGLANVAPTILQLMGLKPAAQMTDSLLLRKLPGKRSGQRHVPRRLRVA